MTGARGAAAVIAALLATVVAALPATVVAAPTAQAAQEVRARAHYERGMIHYELAEFDRAIAEFKKAYALSPQPALLFNIAQAYRAKGDARQATYFYRTFLRLDPDAPERRFVEQHLAELERDAKLGRIEPLARDDAPVSPGRGKRIAGAISGGVGLALVGTSVVFGLEARDSSNEISRLYEEGATWSDRYLDLYEEGRRAERIAIVTGVAGGALVATGVVLYWLGWREHRSAASFSIAPAPHGVTVGVAWEL